MQDEAGRLKAIKQGEVTIVELLDEKILDEAVISQIGERLSELVAQDAMPRIVMDFTQVGHMSSSALGMLITLHIRPTIYEVFEITRLNQVFGILPSREEAVREATAS